MQKDHCLLLKKLKNTGSAHLLQVLNLTTGQWSLTGDSLLAGERSRFGADLVPRKWFLDSEITK